MTHTSWRRLAERSSMGFEASELVNIVVGLVVAAFVVGALLFILIASR